jgi:alpha-ketoglutarate-dependent taurine dioxygenase
MDLDAETLVTFSKRLGEIVTGSSHPVPGIMEVSINPANPSGEYLRGAFQWHFDGSSLETPQKASVLSAEAIADVGGDTEFASTYAAYDDLTEDEKDRFSQLRVVHSTEAHQRGVYPDPTPEQLARWEAGPRREHPLVWRHRSGRRSLVIGVTADHIVGMDPRESRALLDSLLERATRPERLFRHAWSVGDVVIWDNRGVLHRACYYDEMSPRKLLRTTLVGDEPIQ